MLPQPWADSSPQHQPSSLKPVTDSQSSFTHALLCFRFGTSLRNIATFWVQGSFVKRRNGKQGWGQTKSTRWQSPAPLIWDKSHMIFHPAPPGTGSPSSSSSIRCLCQMWAWTEEGQGDIHGWDFQLRAAWSIFLRPPRREQTPAHTYFCAQEKYFQMEIRFNFRAHKCYMDKVWVPHSSHHKCRQYGMKDNI